MPTGYTAPVESGEITELRDFIMLCARAFGACIMLRDEPLSTGIPEKLEPSTRYYDEQIVSLQARIAELTAMSADEALTASLASNDDIRRRYREYEAADQARLERHLAMKVKVEAWQPPTNEHTELKTFMLQQIEVSSRNLDMKLELPALNIGETWRAECLADLGDRLARAQKSRAEEIDRTASRQKWLDDLRGSLPPAGEVAA